MKRILIVATILVALGAGAFLIAQGFLGGFAGDGNLRGEKEVPAISTIGNGSFRADASPYGTALNWELTVLSLEGTITQSHVHIGQEDVNGGISFWLCGTASAPGPAGTQVCPTPPFTIRGTVGPAQIVGPAAQGISPGEFAEVVKMMQAGKTYANVHSVPTWPGGEIRSQIMPTGGGGGQASFGSAEPVHSGH